MMDSWSKYPTDESLQGNLEENSPASVPPRETLFPSDFSADSEVLGQTDSRLENSNLEATQVLADSLLKQGLECHQAGQFEAAIKLLKEGYIAYRELGNEQGQGKALSNLGLTYYNLRHYTRAIEYCLKGLEFAQKLQDRRSIIKILSTLGNAYRHLKDQTKAIEYQKQSLAIAQRSKTVGVKWQP
jgi:Tetratricopeptide repeat.